MTHEFQIAYKEVEEYSRIFVYITG